MAAGRFVKGGGIDRGVHGLFKIGHFLRAFVQKKNDQFHLGIVGPDGARDRFQENGLAAAGRRHDESALPLAEGCHQVQHAHGRWN